MASDTKQREAQRWRLKISLHEWISPRISETRGKTHFWMYLNSHGIFCFPSAPLSWTDRKIISINTSCMQKLEAIWKHHPHHTHSSKARMDHEAVRFKANTLYSTTLKFRNPDTEMLETAQRSWTLAWESPLSHDPVNSGQHHQRPAWTHTNTDSHTLLLRPSHTGTGEEVVWLGTIATGQGLAAGVFFPPSPPILWIKGPGAV